MAQNTLADYQWLAGIIDAEGSIEMRWQLVRRGKKMTPVRCHCLRISTTDDFIIPRISKILSKRYTPGYRKIIRLTGYQVRKLLPHIIDFLYIKQPQAKYVLEALSIKKSTNTQYTDTEAARWEELRLRVKALNERGACAIEDVELRDHTFSWPWLAGIIDGDGTVTVGKFGTTMKPIIKVSLAHLMTIDYLSCLLCTGTLSAGTQKRNKRKMRAIRLMSTKILQIAPQVIEFLVLKKERMELALQIASIRNSIPNGQHNNPQVALAKRLVDKLISLNVEAADARRINYMRS